MNMMGMYGAFFNVVAQKVGMEKAIDLMSKADENLGASLGKMTKEQMGIKALDVPTASAIMNGMAETYGITSEIMEEPDTVIVKNYKCPFYEGLQSAGFDHNSIESSCRNGTSVIMNSFFGQLDPSVKYQLRKFRSSPDDHCVEEIVLKT
jgi:hypothetical protein